MVTNSDDSRRWAAVAGRDRRDEFQEQYRLHGAAVYSVARDLCGTRVAADVTREVFLNLWHHPEQHVAAETSLRATLLRSAHRVAVDTVLSATPPPPGPRLDEGAPAGAIGVGRPTTDGAATHSQPLGMLREEQRSAIVLVTSGSCTLHEAAVALGREERAVKQMIRAGLKQLAGAHRHDAATAPEGSDPTPAREPTSQSDHRLSQALDAREVVAHAQGILMERRGQTATEAFVDLLRLSARLGMTMPVCAARITATTQRGSLHPA